MESTSIDASSTDEDDSVNNHTYKEDSSDSEITDIGDPCEEELVSFSINDALLAKLCDWLNPVIGAEDFLMSLVTLDCISFLTLCYGFFSFHWESSWHIDERVYELLIDRPFFKVQSD